MRSVFFSLGNDQESTVAIINALPKSWKRVSGKLQAPQALCDSDRVIQFIELFISHSYFIRPVTRDTIMGAAPSIEVQYMWADIFSLYAAKKDPFRVAFDNTGESDYEKNFEVARRFASHYVGIGYTGWLHFYREVRNSSSDRKEICSLHLSGHIPGSLLDTPLPLVEFSWEGGSGDEGETLTGLIDLCEKKLHLKKIPRARIYDL